MSQENEQGPQKSLGYTIQSQHPGITNEIQGAINTLRKLQKITTTNDSSVAGGPRPDGTLGHGSSEDGEFELDAQASGSVPTLTAGESFGRYQIARQLGRGAMGAVYLAYDSQLQRYVALKTPFLGNNPVTVQRFFREARATAQLRSPYICPIYDVGQISGIYFISMAFIDGRSLGQVISDGQLRDLDKIAEMIKKIARGLQKAHEKGIIHRDLKPDNIMLDGDGEPIVMDFGLARRVDDEVQLTMAGRILGTPAYMSPEQIEGDSKKIGTPTDIYSLGAVLYQMLTLKMPFQGSLTSVLRKVGSEEPPRPSVVAPEIGQNTALERICVKMMSKKVEDRYATMADVIAALDGKLAAQETAAAKPSLFKKISGWFSGRRDSKAEKPAPTPPSGEGSLSKPSVKTPEKSSQADGGSKDKSVVLSQTIEVGSTDLEGLPIGSRSMMTAMEKEKASGSHDQAVAVNRSELDSASQTFDVEAINQKASDKVSRTIQSSAEIQRNAPLDSQTVDLPADKKS